VTGGKGIYTVSATNTTVASIDDERRLWCNHVGTTFITVADHLNQATSQVICSTPTHAALFAPTSVPSSLSLLVTSNEVVRLGVAATDVNSLCYSNCSALGFEWKSSDIDVFRPLAGSGTAPGKCECDVLSFIALADGTAFVSSETKFITSPTLTVTVHTPLHIIDSEPPVLPIPFDVAQVPIVLGVNATLRLVVAGGPQKRFNARESVFVSVPSALVATIEPSSPEFGFENRIRDIVLHCLNPHEEQSVVFSVESDLQGAVAQMILTVVCAVPERIFLLPVAWNEPNQVASTRTSLYHSVIPAQTDLPNL
jgi:hypothetical protein